MRSGIKRVFPMVDQGQNMEVFVVIEGREGFLRSTRAVAALDIITTRHPLVEGFISIPGHLNRMADVERGLIGGLTVRRGGPSVEGKGFKSMDQDHTQMRSTTMNTTFKAAEVGGGSLRQKLAWKHPVNAPFSWTGSECTLDIEKK